VIDLKFGLYWSGNKMSYLRYLTFLSLRKFHPLSEIELYISDEYEKNIEWENEAQDFQNNNFTQEIYIEELEKLDINILKYENYNNYAPNYISDFFRWEWLSKNNGFYLDTDQIILKSFDSIDRNFDFIYSSYNAPSCGLYYPVGVIGSHPNSEIIKWINDLLPQFYNKNDYNSLGPNMLKTVFNMRKWKDRLYNTKYELFYPIKDSCLVENIYREDIDGNLILNEIEKAYALHWFGGHHASQNFNKSFSEEKAKTELNLISNIIRRKL
jgi:hypothetical protein